MDSPFVHPPMYPSVSKFLVVMLTRFLNSLLRIAVSGVFSFSTSGGRRHDGTVGQDPRPSSSNGFICRSFDASQAQALDPSHAAQPLFVHESRFPQPERQPVTQLPRSACMLANSRHISCCQSGGWGHGRGSSCPSSLICGPRCVEAKNV